MERTAGLDSDIRGASNSIVYNPNEIGIDNANIAAGNFVVSNRIVAEGMRHIHVWVQRSNAAVPLGVRLAPVVPSYVAAPGPGLITHTPATAWAASVNTYGSFYFGISAIFTSGDGQTFAYSPIFAVRIDNTDPALAVNVSAWVHCMD